MPRKFPYRFINGLPQKTQAELWRNFEAVGAHEEIIPFASIGDLVVVTSAPKRVRSGGVIRITADLSAGLTGATTVDIILNGDVVYTLTIASTITEADELTDVRAVPGDILVLDVTAVGAGSASATFDIVMAL